MDTVTVINGTNAMEYIVGNKLIIPETMVNLREIRCTAYGLRKVIIPDTVVNLRKINCSINEIQRLVLPPTLAKLEEIDCSRCNISELIIPASIHLTELHCERCYELETLNISSVDRLVKLDCGGCNKLSKLDLDGANRMVYLDCGDNNLQFLRVPKQLKLCSDTTNSHNKLYTDTGFPPYYPCSGVQCGGSLLISDDSLTNLKIKDSPYNPNITKLLIVTVKRELELQQPII